MQTLVVGIATGAIYGLVATGFALVYRLTGVLQFAHGDLAGTAAFVAIVVAAGTGSAASTPGWRSVVGFAAAIASGALAGALLYVIAIRPFFGRPSAIGWIGSTVAVSFGLQGTLAAVFPRAAYVVPDPFGSLSANLIHLPDGAVLPWRTVLVLGLGLAIALSTRTLLRRTMFGAAVTAIASDQTGARLVGLPVERLVTGAFALAGVLGAVAGTIGTPSGAPIGVQTGAVLGLKGIAAAMLGGFDNPDRVFAAAIGIGILESVVTTLHVPGVPALALGAAWRDIMPLLLVVVVLALRPPRHAREIAE